MKVAIDISQIVYGTGVSVYTKELVTELSKSKDLELVLFAGVLRKKSEIQNFINSLNGVSSTIYPFSPELLNIIWNRLHILPIDYLVGKVDLVHTSDWTEPPARIPKVTTVHDLAPILLASETNPRVVAVHKNKLKWVKKESSRIIVPSESTKKDLVGLGFDTIKIDVIYEALSSEFKASKKTNNQSDKYLLAVGTAKRKNIENISKAFNLVKKEFELSELVVVGEKPNDPISGVKYTGRVSDQKLSELYANAQALVYTSLYEGFGLPILESFASHTPVVTSNVSSMPEVAGNAAVLVDPNIVEAISKGVGEAIRSRNLLVKAGVKQLNKFSWAINARKTLGVYKKALEYNK